MRRAVRAAATIVGLAVGVVALASACAVPLGDLGGPSSTAMDINEAGVVVGMAALPDSPDGDPTERPFRRTPDGVVVELMTPPGTIDGAAMAINDAGEVAGMALVATGTSDDEMHALRWASDGTLHDLGSIGDANAMVRDLDDHGRIVGTAYDGDGNHAFVIDPATGDEPVGLPDIAGGESSTAFGMNDEGDVVGYQWIEGGATSAPVRWDLDAWTATDLTAAWGGSGLLTDINDAGTIAGVARFPAPPPMTAVVDAAILRPGASAPIALGVGGFGYPLAITDAELVVGSLLGPAKAFSWTADTGLVWLVPSGESQAWGANERGQVVGQHAGHAAWFVVPPS
jgi:hypothetical protein